MNSEAFLHGIYKIISTNYKCRHSSVVTQVFERNVCFQKYMLWRFDKYLFPSFFLSMVELWEVFPLLNYHRIGAKLLLKGEHTLTYVDSSNYIEKYQWVWRSFMNWTIKFIEIGCIHLLLVHTDNSNTFVWHLTGITDIFKICICNWCLVVSPLRIVLIFLSVH